MGNMAQNGMLYLRQDSHQQLYNSYKRSNIAFSVLLYFTLKEILTKYTSLKFNALSTHLLNKQIAFLDKNVSIVLLFYNYSSIL